MISSPITSMLSRGQELQNPPEDHSGVLKRFLCSTGSGRLTTMPSDCNSATKPSSSRCAGSIMILGYRQPASSDWACAAMPGMLQVTTGWPDGMTAPSSLPTITTSSGSHSLCEFTGETCPAGAASGPTVRVTMTASDEGHGAAAWVWRQRDYAESACPRVWTLNDVSLAPTRKVYRLIRAISPSGVLASTFSRVSLRCRLAWKSESVVMLRAVASCSESKPKHQSSRLSFSEAVKRGAFEVVDSAWSGT